VSTSPRRLALEGIVKQWDARKPPILAGIDLDIPPGTIVSLTGENGAGKTTLLRILAGLIFPDRGEIRLDGLDPRKNRVEYQRRLGLVSAGSSGLYARMSAARHLDFACRISFVPRSERARAREEAIARFGMAEFAFQRVDRLSMGQRQRVRLAMALVHHPLLVLLDEPWNSLDSEGSRVVAETLTELRAAGAIVICCTPTGTDIATQIQDLDSVVLLEDGQLLPA
jgi:ABC-type multidrug transport system ATPase subunit